MADDDIIASILQALKAALRVIALGERSKKPKYRGGYKNATQSRKRVRDHWRQYPKDNYGIATGSRSGIFVIDIDGVKGETSWKALCAKHGLPPPTVTVVTSNGQHHYFQTNGARIGNSAGKLAPGIDVRGEGGYVVGAGSVHPSGHVYRYADGHDPNSMPIAAAPAWLLQLLAKPKPTKPVQSKADPDQQQSKRSLAYGKAALEAELRRLASAPLHQRNDTLNRCAFRLGQLSARRYLVEAEIVSRLTQTATKLGLNADEIPRTIRSGVEAGKQSPRATSPGTEDPDAKRVAGSDDDPLAEALARLGCTDADNAERFVRRRGASFAYCPDRAWLAWDGKRWQPDSAQARVLAATETARQIAAEIPYLTDKREQEQRAGHAKQSLSKAALDRMLGLAAPMMTVRMDQLDADPFLLNVANGTVDLRTGKLRNHDPRDMITKLAPVEYNPKARAPTFRKFLRRVLQRDLPLLRYSRRVCGYSLTGSNKEQVFFYVRGRQKNGKSTFVNCFCEMLGDYGMNTPTETLLVKVHDNNIPNDLARLKGTRMVTAIEAPAGKQLNEARIKSITGGDPITARFMRGEWFSFTPEFKLWFVANDDPRVRSTDDALWRRIRVIPFDVVIPDDEVDPDLPTKLRAEWPGILAWAVRGCLRWQRDGLQTPVAVHAATSSYRKRADHLARFIRECLITGEDSETASSAVYQAYADWCSTVHEHPLSVAKFKGQLEDRGFEHARVKSGSVWRKVRLKR